MNSNLPPRRAPWLCGGAGAPGRPQKGAVPCHCQGGSATCHCQGIFFSFCSGPRNYVASLAAHFSTSLVLRLTQAHTHIPKKIIMHFSFCTWLHFILFYFICLFVYALTSVSGPEQGTARWFSLRASFQWSVMEL